MIGLKLEPLMAGFEYDIYSLVKAFYPKEEIKTNFLEAPLLLEIKSQQQNDQIALVIIWSELLEKLEEQRVVTISEPAQKKDRKTIKNLIKQGIYQILSERTKKILPWGTLTGIRPVKIPYFMLEEGRKDEEISDFMKRTYLTGKEKIALSIEIAKKERELLSKIDYQNGYSIYIGIPFCPTRCLYCSFPSYPLKIWEKRVEQYINALCYELEAVFQIMQTQKKRIHTVYFGGGTPTTLTPEQLGRLLEKLVTTFDLKDNLEFTVEAGRPDSITKDKLSVLQQYGVNRISVNPQTMNQKTLDLIGRQHTTEQTKEAFWLVRECGFTNINMDIITGLPGETKEDMEFTMQELAKLKPDSVTVHSLALKRASRLKEQQEQYADYISRNDEKITAMTERYAREMGLQPYYLYRQKNMTGNLENVGYASAGKAGIYNILIMEEVQTIVACGAGSISKRVYPDGCIERCENVKDVSQYIERIGEMIERKRVLLEG
ncbi:MAG: coproporphyrinogen dehydrogenase HemZ [Lachnospiraceae bacterium]|nr:coproporphyrinogen dehydrogenase HemZ [Lachnospiraceae bacterium]